MSDRKPVGIAHVDALVILVVCDDGAVFEGRGNGYKESNGAPVIQWNEMTPIPGTDRALPPPKFP